jgi:hypothetical protein
MWKKAALDVPRVVTRLQPEEPDFPILEIDCCCGIRTVHSLREVGRI